MTAKVKPLSASARAVLTLAALRGDKLVQLPRLPAAAARQVIRSMLNAGLVEDLAAETMDPAYVWRTGQDGQALALRATALGLGRVVAEGAGAAVALLSAGTAGEAPAETGVPDGTDPEVPLTTLVPASEDMPATAAQTGQRAQERSDDANLGDDAAPASTQAAEGARKPTIAVEPAGRRDRLRQAAQALLDVWDGLAGSKHTVIDALAGPIDNLRAALARKTLASAKIDSSRTPRNTKQTQVLAMLRRNEGASGPQIAEAMGWAPHTVRDSSLAWRRRGSGSACWSASVRLDRTGPAPRAATQSIALSMLIRYKLSMLIRYKRYVPRMVCRSLLARRTRMPIVPVATSSHLWL
jgi:hypothetical protein